MVTIAPVIEREGVHFAALGLPDMLNGGGAIQSCSLVHLQALTGGRKWLAGLLGLPGSGSSGGNAHADDGNGSAQQADSPDAFSGIAALVRHHHTCTQLPVCLP